MQRGNMSNIPLHLESGNQIIPLSLMDVPDIANDNRQKFGLKRLKDLILRTCQLPAEEQKLQIMQEIAEFKQDTAQRDDFLIAFGKAISKQKTPALMFSAGLCLK
ncbi:MAG: hypothetical protein KatS3mg028_1248 [Bacteroidia bacterium]|nr:MAG: hypothetical protein KatS3mg028_1248 [Bacteroidia bacterium]